jgi:hypothetical protein
MECLEKKIPFLCFLYQEKTTISQIYSSFAFTTLGFLATIITFLFGLSERAFFRGYLHHGHFGNLLVIYFTTMTSLIFTFFTSILCIYSRLWFDLASMGVLLNILQLGVLCIIGFNITSRALKS